jgi:hypothetical protein
MEQGPSRFPVAHNRTTDPEVQLRPSQCFAFSRFFHLPVSFCVWLFLQIPFSEPNPVPGLWKTLAQATGNPLAVAHKKAYFFLANIMPQINLLIFLYIV